MNAQQEAEVRSIMANDEESSDTEILIRLMEDVNISGREAEEAVGMREQYLQEGI